MGILSIRMETVQESATLAINKKAAEMKAAGLNVINMGVGEPDFDTPQNIKKAAIKAIENGLTKYTPVVGTLNLRKAICSKLERENGLRYTVDQVMVGTGAKQLLFNAIMSTVDTGDEVIIPAPYWGSYVEMVMFAGGKPVVVQCGKDDGFKLTAKALKAVITEKTKWLMLNSPSNPTGAVYSADELKELANVLLAHDNVYILSDDIYEHMIFTDKKFANILNVEPGLRDRTLLVNGVSKNYAMTGWRIGYCAGPVEIIKAMTTVQSHSTSGACSISQEAACEALNGDQSFVAMQRESLMKRRNILLNLLGNVAKVKTYVPDGAFYLFLDCTELIGATTQKGDKLANCADIAKFFLEEAHVATVPGAAFGAPGFIRLSYAISEADIKVAISAIATSVHFLT